MSTRSGRRIHKAEAEPVAKSERKTRGKRRTENEVNLDVTVPRAAVKRQNYVQYPTDSNSTDDEPNNVNVQLPPKLKKGKKTRRNTLRELNSDLPAFEDNQQGTEPTKIPRLTRQTRKFVQNTSEEHTDLVSGLGDGAKEDYKINSGSKKNKVKKQKSKENASDDGRTPQQGQETGSRKARKKIIPKIAQQQAQELINNGGIYSSVESYHTAIGSPLSNTQDTEPEEDDVIFKDCATLNETYEKYEKHESTVQETENINGTSDKAVKLDGTFDKTEKLNGTFDKPIEIENLRTSLEKPDTKQRSKKKQLKIQAVDVPDESVELSPMDTTFDKQSDFTLPKNKLNDTFEKKSNKLNSTADISNASKTGVKLNGTFDKSPKPKSLDTTFDKSESQKLSLISSDRDSNVTLDKSDESPINITSDEDDETENIVNTTPLLIESSIDESMNDIHTSMGKSKSFDNRSNSNTVPTPLKRDSTFTRDSPESNEDKTSPPTMAKTSMSAAGSTPFHTSRTSSRVSRKDRSTLNITRSIEKPIQNPTSELEPSVLRQTRVMFCSPTNNPVVESTMKRKIIKSSIKGSNKTFVFQDKERASSATRPSALPTRQPAAALLSRKRSLTSGDADGARSKRSRLDTNAPSLPRAARTRAATAQPQLKRTTPLGPATPRTALPDFAALHQRRFDKMESLQDCQRRKAQRARELLTPTKLHNRVEQQKSLKVVKTPSTSSAAAVAAPKPVTFDSLRPGFTRYGFKMNHDANPFSVPSKTDTKANANRTQFSIGKLANKTTEKEKREVKVSGSKIPQPSSRGVTAMSKEKARQVVMREGDKTNSRVSRRERSRSEARVTIKGVRTNRRFELQMQMRNLD